MQCISAGTFSLKRKEHREISLQTRTSANCGNAPFCKPSWSKFLFYHSVFVRLRAESGRRDCRVGLTLLAGYWARDVTIQIYCFRTSQVAPANARPPALRPLRTRMTLSPPPAAQASSAKMQPPPPPCAGSCARVVVLAFTRAQCMMSMRRRACMFMSVHACACRACVRAVRACKHVCVCVCARARGRVRMCARACTSARVFDGSANDP